MLHKSLTLQKAAALGLNLSQNVGVIQALFAYLHQRKRHRRLSYKLLGPQQSYATLGRGTVWPHRRNCIGVGTSWQQHIKTQKQTVQPLHHSPTAV